MKPVSIALKAALAFAVGAIFVSAPTLAEKPSWAGAGRGAGEEHRDRRNEQAPERPGGPSVAARGHFDEGHREFVREYYKDQFGRGRCPPGLAKKRDGCMPPGQARKWQLGRPLPRDTVYYAIPQPLAVRIGPPPSGYRYVRVASDILLIAIGTGMVVDAIQDLGR